MEIEINDPDLSELLFTLSKRPTLKAPKYSQADIDFIDGDWDGFFDDELANELHAIVSRTIEDLSTDD